jgi:hypothetical protein
MLTLFIDNRMQISRFLVYLCEYKANLHLLRNNYAVDNNLPCCICIFY